MANRQTSLVLLGTLLAVAALGVVSLTSNTRQIAQVIEGLQGISIPLPAGGGAYGLEDPVRLTAQGDVGTSTMPVRAVWSYKHSSWQSMREIPGCGNVKTCTFTVTRPEEAGTYAVTADASDRYATVSIVIEERLANPFRDALPGWAQEAVIRMNRLGIIRGYDNGSFGPGDPVTRAQMVTLLARLLEARRWVSFASCNEAYYADVPAGHFARGPLCAFAINGWVDSPALLPGQRFSPDAPSTRAFTAKLVARSVQAALAANGERPSAGTEFDDVVPGHPYFPSIQSVSGYGIMTGNPNGDFNPEGTLNRAEAAVILHRIWPKLAIPGNASSAAAVSSAASAGASSARVDSAVCNATYVKLLSDPRNCGRCGNVCPSASRASGVCWDGVCGLGCIDGWRNLDGNTANGCEAPPVGD